MLQCTMHLLCALAHRTPSAAPVSYFSTSSYRAFPSCGSPLAWEPLEAMDFVFSSLHPQAEQPGRH